MSKTFILLTLFLLIIILSCKKEDTAVVNPCSVTNPAQDLPWLRDRVASITQEDSSYQYIQQAEYNGQTVFYFGNCCPSCNTVAPVLDCQGELICYVYSKECPDILDKLKNRITIATAKKTLCNL